MGYALTGHTFGSRHALFLFAPSQLGEKVVGCNAPDEVINGSSLADYVPIEHGVAVEAYACTHPLGVATREAAFIPSP